MRAQAPRLVVTAARLALAGALAFPLAAAAEKADREKEIQVLADRLAADDSKKEAVYEGVQRGGPAGDHADHPGEDRRA